MIIKYLIAFILFASSCLAGMGIGGFPYPGPGNGVVGAGGGECNKLVFNHAPSWVNTKSLARYSSEDYVGAEWTGGPLSVCGVTFDINPSGDISSFNYTVSIFDSSKILKGTSGTINGLSISWTSKFIFPTNISLASGDFIVIHRVDLGDSSSNYVTVSFGSSDSSSLGSAVWTSVWGVTENIPTQDFFLKLYGN